MTRQQLAAAATVAFLGAGALLYAGSIAPGGDGSNLYGEVTLPDAGTPTQCVYREGYAAPEVLGLWVPGYDGGASYALVRVCAEATDGGDEDVSLPAAYAALPYVFAEVEAAEPFTGGAHIQVWTQGHEGAPFACACSTGADCTADGEAAMLGVTLSPGTWSGAGCEPKPCNEWAGHSSWPAECPL